MENYEKVEKLRERANVSYEEAKEALEKNNWDILDAMIQLEKSGKARGPEKTSYSTQDEKRYEGVVDDGPEKSHGFSDMLKRLGGFLARLVRKGCENDFSITKNGREILNVPVIVLVIAFLLAFWLVGILLVVGLFFDLRYHFHGPDIKSVDFNQAMDSAADTAAHIKNEFSNTDHKSNNPQ